MISFEALIEEARRTGCSDIHLTPGQAPSFRKVGNLERSDLRMDAESMESMILSLLTHKQKAAIDNGDDVDFCFVSANGSRQRINIFRERGHLCCAVRLLNAKIPTLEELQLPPVLKKLALLPRGLILVTGPTGSGKSTTLAAMVDYINQNRKAHILTIEDPIEYEHQNKQSLTHQREVGVDVSSFADALRSALREDPDVILVGEMRDYETISAALTAAETGHLVLSTLHTIGAANTIDRIIDVFPSEGQHQVRSQLSSVLQGIITQCLIPAFDGKSRMAALEILTGTDAVRNLIRDNKCHQISSMMQTGAKDGMRTLAQDLGRLVSERKITSDTAFAVAPNPEELRQFLNVR